MIETEIEIVIEADLSPRQLRKTLDMAVQVENRDECFLVRPAQGTKVELDVEVRKAFCGGGGGGGGIFFWGG